MQTMQTQLGHAHPYGQPQRQQPPQQGPSVAEMVRGEQQRQEKAEALAERNQEDTNTAVTKQILSQKADVDTDGNGIISLAEAMQAKGKDASSEVKSLIHKILELQHQMESQSKQFHGADTNGNLVANDTMAQTNQALFGNLGSINITA